MAIGDSSLGALRLELGLESDDFKKSVTEINRQLRVVQSEFSAVNDGTKEWATSTEGLTAKNEMLTRKLGLQGKRVEELKKTYERLAEEKGADAKATQDAMREYNNALGQMRRTEAQIRQVSDALQEQGKRFDKAKQKIDEYADKASDVAGRLSGTLTPAIAGLGAGALKVADDFEGGMSRIQRRLGVTESEAKELNKTARDLWKEGFSESLEEVENGLLTVRQNIKGINKADLKEVTKNALFLAETFDSDINEVTRAGQNLMKGFGITSERALDLMAWGGQKGLNFSQEMFDNLAEYSPLFAKMGFSAEDYFQLLEKGSQAGVYNLDYINDVMKEFQIRVKDGSKSTSEAMGEMSESTQKVWKEFLTGKKTVKDVHNAVIKDLSSMEDQTKANELGVAVYGTKFEDLESDAMYTLGNITGGIEDVDGAMKRSGDAVDKTFTQKLRSSFRKVSDSLVPLGDMLIDIADRTLPKVEKAIISVTKWWDGLSDSTKQAVLAVGGLTAIIPPLVVVLAPVVKTFTSLFGVIGRVVASIGAGAGATAGAGTLTGALTVLGSSVAIAGGILAGLGLGFLVLDKHMDKPIFKTDIFSDKISEATESILTDYGQLQSESNSKLSQMAWGNEEITETHINNMIGLYKKMSDQILLQMDEQYAKQKEKMIAHFAESDALSEEEELKILADMDTQHQTERQKVIDNNDKKIEILKNMDGMTKEEKIKANQEINEIEKENYDLMIANTVQNKDEYLAIKEELNNQSGILSAQQAGKIVADSQKTTKDVVKEAEKKYNDTVSWIEYERDVTGNISEEKANTLIKDAENQKNKTVSQAEDQHYEIVKQAQGQAGKHVNEVNWETGSVMNRWDRMWNRIADVWNPIANMFNLDKITKRGEYKVNARQRLKDTGATFKALAKGTQNGTHEGGLALVGEEGVELAHIPNKGYTMLGVGGQEFVDLPRGSSVLPNKYTNDILKQYGFPAYAKGVGDFDLFDIFTKGAKSFWNSALENSGIYKNVVMPDWFASTRKILSEISGGVVGKIKDAMDNFLSFSNYRGGGADIANKAITQALLLLGKPMSWLQPMMTIAQKESGFNPRAINLWDINAQRGDPSVGLFQIIQSTWNRHRMRGMNDRTNPLHSAVTAIRYMDSRYGGVFGHPGIKSMARGGGYKPYAEGGIINEEQLALLGEDDKQEIVIPLDRSRNKSMDLLAYANLRLGVFERFENFFEQMLLQLKTSTKEIVSSFNQGYLAENNLFIPPTFYNNPNPTNSTLSTTNNTYQINVSYNGSANQNDVSQLAQQIKRELERMDEINSRSYGVIA